MFCFPFATAILTLTGLFHNLQTIANNKVPAKATPNAVRKAEWVDQVYGFLPHVNVKMIETAFYSGWVRFDVSSNSGVLILTLFQPKFSD